MIRLSRGVWYMLLATFLFSSMNALVKLLPHIPAVELVFFRSLISLAMSYGVLRSVNVPIWGHNKKLLILRGIAGAVSLLLYFTMLQQIPFASAVTLQYMAPIFSAILSFFVLKEKVTPVQWFFFLLSFAGVLVVNGFDIRVEPVHLLMGIVAAVASAVAFVTIRTINTQEHPLVIVLYFPLVTLPLTGLYSVFHWVQPQGWDWLILLGVGVLTQFAQYFMTKSYQVEEVSEVAILRYLSLIYALGFGYVFFQETFSFMSYLGMLLVVVGVVLNMIYKQYWQKSKIAREKRI